MWRTNGRTPHEINRTIGGGDVHILYTYFGRRFQVLRAVGQLTEKPKLVVVQHVDTLMVGTQVVHLFFVHARPKVGAYEFQDFQLFLVPRQLLRYPVRQKKFTHKRRAVNTRLWGKSIVSPISSPLDQTPTTRIAQMFQYRYVLVLGQHTHAHGLNEQFNRTQNV